MVKRLGDVEKVYLLGQFARGLDSKIIDLVFVGDIDQSYLVKLIAKVEEIINRKIRYLIYDAAEFNQMLEMNGFEMEPLLLWQKDK